MSTRRPPPPAGTVKPPAPPVPPRPGIPTRKPINGLAVTQHIAPPVLSPEKKNQVPSDVPDLPEGMELGEIGFKVWCKLTRLFQKAGTFNEQMKHPLYTLCSLEEVAHELKTQFIGEMMIDVRGQTKLNPAVTEWGKIVNLLKGYYAEFQCTPRSAGGGPPEPAGGPIPNRKGVLGSDPKVIFGPDQQAAASN